jgi:hypothetical protein
VEFEGTQASGAKSDYLHFMEIYNIVPYSWSLFIYILFELMKSVKWVNVLMYWHQ